MYNKKLIVEALRNLNKPGKVNANNSKAIKSDKKNDANFISAKDGVNSPIYKKVSVRPSNIHGKGLFADQPISKGDIIGVSHIRKKFMKDGEEYQAPFPSKVLGYYNHHEIPNVAEVDMGDHVLMKAIKNISPNQEILSNYDKTVLPDLEGSADFKYKKGGTNKPTVPNKKSPKSYSRSFEATNRLFAQHPLFKKPKSKKNKIFDPKSQYYEEGGENDCPTGFIKDENGNCVWHDEAQENNIIDESTVHPVEYLRSQLSMDNPFYNTHSISLDEEGKSHWKTAEEDKIKYNLRNTALNKFIQRHPDESTGLELGYLHNNIWTSPTLGLETDPMEPGYAPNQLRFEREGHHPNVYFIKNPVEGNAEAPSGTYMKSFQEHVNKDLSKNNAYNRASNDLGRALLEKGYKGENMWGKNDPDQLYQLYGTEGALLKGVTEVTPETLLYLKSITNSEEGKKYLAKMAGISENDPDYSNMLMHYNTTPIDVYAKTARPQYEDINSLKEKKDEQQSFLRNTAGPISYADGGLVQYEPGGASADPPDWFTKRGANVYFNPAYQNNFTGSTNRFDSYSEGFPIYKVNPSAVVGIEGSLSKGRDASKEKGRGWTYNANIGLPYDSFETGNFTPSAGLMLDAENSPQDKNFRPHVQIGADYNPTDGFSIAGTTGARFPLTPYGNKRVKPGYGVGHLDLYGGARFGLIDRQNTSSGLIYGARVHGKYMPKWLNKLSRGSYFYGDAGIQFDPIKGKSSQKSDDVTSGGAYDMYGQEVFGTTKAQDPGTKWGATVYANAGIKKDIDDIKFSKDKRAKKIQQIEDSEKYAEREREEKQVEEKKEKPKKECPEGEMRYCADCPCEPYEKAKHPRWLQYGGLIQYGPGGMMDEPPGSKKKPPRDPNRILPRWLPDNAIKAIQNTEIGISPYISNMNSLPTGLLTGEGNKMVSVSSPSYGITTSTGLGKRNIHKNDSKGWSLDTYIGKPYDDSRGDMIGQMIENAGQEAHDARWGEYYDDLAAWENGTMPTTQAQGFTPWDPEKDKPKYDGRKMMALGRVMQKSPIVAGAALNYQHPLFKQPHGYKAGGKGKIGLDFDPNNQVGLSLEGGIDFYGGSKRKDYRPGQSKYSINPKVIASLGTRPNFGFGLTAGVEGLPKFMPKKFPGYFYADANYAQGFIGPGNFSANAGMKFPLSDLKKRRAQTKVKEKEIEDKIQPNTTSPGSTKTTTYGYQDGGFTLQLDDNEIQKYVDGGYVIEDISNDLPKAGNGKLVKERPVVEKIPVPKMPKIFDVSKIPTKIDISKKLADISFNKYLQSSASEKMKLIADLKNKKLISQSLPEGQLVTYPNLLNLATKKGIRDALTFSRSAAGTDYGISTSGTKTTLAPGDLMAYKKFGIQNDPLAKGLYGATHVPWMRYGQRMGLSNLPYETQYVKVFKFGEGATDYIVANTLEEAKQQYKNEYGQDIESSNLVPDIISQATPKSLDALYTYHNNTGMPESVRKGVFDDNYGAYTSIVRYPFDYSGSAFDMFKRFTDFENTTFGNASTLRRTLGREGASSGAIGAYTFTDKPTLENSFIAPAFTFPEVPVIGHPGQKLFDPVAVYHKPEIEKIKREQALAHEMYSNEKYEDLINFLNDKIKAGEFGSIESNITNIKADPEFPKFEGTENAYMLGVINPETGLIDTGLKGAELEKLANLANQAFQGYSYFGPQNKAYYNKSNVVKVPYSPFRFKFEEGGQYELGDEVDEPTMKELTKLGFTFEKI